MCNPNGLYNVLVESRRSACITVSVCRYASFIKDLYNQMLIEGPDSYTWVHPELCEGNCPQSFKKVGLEALVEADVQVDPDSLYARKMMEHAATAIEKVTHAVFVCQFLSPTHSLYRTRLHHTAPHCMHHTAPHWLALALPHTGSLCLASHCLTLTHSLSLGLVVMMKSKELKTSRSVLMLILRFSQSQSPYHLYLL